MTKHRVRKATESDLVAVKAIADSERRCLGFITRAIFLGSLASGELVVAEDSLRHIVGFLRWHHRLDGWNTVYEICVAKEARARGVGRKLLRALPHPIRLKCPVDNASNVFYRRLGFTLQAVEPGRRRQLNLWVLTQ